jgi:hypothetical protein
LGVLMLRFFFQKNFSDKNGGGDNENL